LLSGDDATALGFVAQGGNGCISVVSNIAPGVCRDMYLALKGGETSRAQRLAVALSELTRALFKESNPAPVKYALSLLKLMQPTVRLPLVELTNDSKTAVACALERLCGTYADGMIGKISAGPNEIAPRRVVGGR
jgi:4-hydroxy-tetrahydrodipicolinate synthase